MKTQVQKSNRVMFSLLAAVTLNAVPLAAQQLYDNFEGVDAVSYTTSKTAKLDTLAVNPSREGVNSSANCAKFTRSRQRYDYVKMFPQGKVADVAQYATYDPKAPKFKMKVFTTAPVGTLVEIQLGKKTGIAYPDGTHSQYQARTTQSGVWEELEFSYVVSPKGSHTSNNEVDQVTLLFSPNSNNNDVYYFDDLEGPALTAPSHNAAARLFRRK